MAVRAEKNAFLQLSLRLLPRACDPVLGDAEVLRRAIEVVELEHLMGPRPSAAGAEAAEMLDRAPLQSPAISDRRCLLSARRRDVPGAVAVRAKEFTLSGLEPEPRPRHAHAADSEFLCAGVAVMKLERRDGAAITAGFALSTAFAHELELQLLALLLLVAVRLRVATTAAMLDQLRVGDRSRWRFRRVVGAKGRAFKAEMTAVQRARLAIDRDLRGERGPAPLARLQLRSSRNALAWTGERSMRPARQAVLAATEVQSLAVNDYGFRELRTAGPTNLHDRTLVLSSPRVKGRPAPAGGFEPPTKGLTVLCTTVVLRRKD